MVTLCVLDIRHQKKIGGWQQLSVNQETVPGAARAQLAFTSLKGERYTAIGTSQGLFIYYGEQFYDITPLATAITGATFDTFSGLDNVTVNKPLMDYKLEDM